MNGQHNMNLPENSIFSLIEKNISDKITENPEVKIEAKMNERNKDIKLKTYSDFIEETGENLVLSRKQVREDLFSLRRDLNNSNKQNKNNSSIHNHLKISRKVYEDSYAIVIPDVILYT